MSDSISFALRFAAKPSLIALCVVGGVVILAVIVAIIAYYVRKNKSNQASFPNGEALLTLILIRFN